VSPSTEPRDERNPIRPPGDPIITTPLPGDECFFAVSQAARWSQAAQLIGLSTQLRGDASLLEEMGDARERLRLPRVDSIDPIDLVESESLDRALEIPEEPTLGFMRRNEYELWREASSDGDAAAATRLIYLSLRDPHEFVRIAAAVSWAAIARESPPLVLDILRAGCESPLETARHLAANALADVAPSDPALSELVEDEPFDGPPEPVRTSLLVHGTWSRWPKKLRRGGKRWWEPGGGFHRYVRRHASPDLYNGRNTFRWSGVYDQRGRDEGTEGLRRWAALGGVDHFDVLYAHSYGGTLALAATEDGTNPGIKIRLLLLLSTPGHLPPGTDWSRISRAVSLRTTFDLVLLADRSANALPPPVELLKLPGLTTWFAHGATHSVRVWKRYGIADEVKFESSQTPWPPR
jgi:hypothetical protein